MPVLKPRNRVVYFRVSEEEFNSLQSMCSNHGARSLSDLARTAVLNVLEGAGATVENRVLAKLNELDTGINQLNQRLAGMAGRSAEPKD